MRKVAEILPEINERQPHMQFGCAIDVDCANGIAIIGSMGYEQRRGAAWKYSVDESYNVNFVRRYHDQDWPHSTSWFKHGALAGASVAEFDGSTHVGLPADRSIVPDSGLQNSPWYAHGRVVRYDFDLSTTEFLGTELRQRLSQAIAVCEHFAFYGAPGSTEGIGAVMAVPAAGGEVQWIRPDESARSGFGHFLRCNANWLVVGRNTNGGAGAVWIYRLPELKLEFFGKGVYPRLYGMQMDLHGDTVVLCDHLNPMTILRYDGDRWDDVTLPMEAPDLGVFRQTFHRAGRRVAIHGNTVVMQYEKQRLVGPAETGGVIAYDLERKSAQLISGWSPYEMIGDVLKFDANGLLWVGIPRMTVDGHARCGAVQVWDVVW